jgi:hypothetical protein
MARTRWPRCRQLSQSVSSRIAEKSLAAAFFHRRATNDWGGRAIGVLTLTPYDCRSPEWNLYVWAGLKTKGLLHWQRAARDPHGRAAGIYLVGIKRSKLNRLVSQG